MGFWDGKRNEPKVRDPRPKGSQRGVGKRVHDRGPFISPRSSTRSPWLWSGKSDDKFDDKGKRWSWF